MIRTRTLSEIALAISTVCCSATVRPRAGCSTSSSTPSRWKTAFASRCILPAVDDPPAVAMADEDVLGDRQVGEDHRLLVDRDDPQRLRIEGARDRARLAVDHDLAGVRLLDAGHDLDQRRLAGPVLADEGVDLARVEGERAPSSAWVEPKRRETPRTSMIGSGSCCSSVMTGVPPSAAATVTGTIWAPRSRERGARASSG